MNQQTPELLDLELEAPGHPGSPVTLAEAKEFLRIDGADQDASLAIILSAATLWAEGVTRRAFLERAIDVRFRCFPPVGVDLILPYAPVSALTAVTYQTAEGAQEVYDISDLELDPLYGRVRVLPGAAQEWPQGVFSANVRYTAGYGALDADVPDQIRQAVLVGAGSMFETRVDQIVGTNLTGPTDKASAMLLESYRAREF